MQNKPNFEEPRQPERRGKEQSLMNPRTPDGRFPKGVSGNRAGRPAGSRNQATLMIEQLLEGDAEPVGRKLTELAKKGNIAALRLCIERLAPVRKERSCALELPTVQTMQDVLSGLHAIGAAVSCGQITPGEAQTLAAFLRLQGETLEQVDLERRIAALEDFRAGMVEFHRDMERRKPDLVNEAKQPA
jgi:hypothetical protein